MFLCLIVALLVFDWSEAGGADGAGGVDGAGGFKALEALKSVYGSLFSTVNVGNI